MTIGGRPPDSAGPGSLMTQRWRGQSAANPSLLIPMGLWDDCGANPGPIRAPFVETPDTVSGPPAKVSAGFKDLSPPIYRL
jgi:hypothetical protein